MIRKLLLSALALFGICSTGMAAAPQSSVGIVNFVTCITDSKLGKQEQASFEGLKKQMS